MKNFIIKLFLVLIVFFVIALSYLVYHEDTHKAIMKNHNCINVTTYINPFTTSYARCEEYTQRTIELKMQEEYLHSLNEIIGYHFQVLILTIFSIFILSLILGNRGV